MNSHVFNARPYLLVNQIQHYEWGTRDAAAFIPQFLGQTPQPGLPYAELWMGMHPKAPSALLIEGTPTPLPQLAERYPDALLGKKITARFGHTLPFLFKVLSVGAALSIQAHPNKTQAEALHVCNPEQYPDDNHKPEIAIALSPATALVGFKSYEEIRLTLAKYPEIVCFIEAGEGGVLRPVTMQQQRESVRRIYTALMRRERDEQALQDALNQLEQRLQRLPDPSDHERLFLESRRIYDGAEIGLLALFFLNFVRLKRGQGIFLKPGIPHAYLRGNLVECMANSDNVVRAGLTPKFKDVQTLLDILTYELGPTPILGQSTGAQETVYAAPVIEFQVRRWQLAGGESRQEKGNDQPAVLLITEGELTLRWQEEGEAQQQVIRRGQSLFIPACLPGFELVAESTAEVFKAGVP
ncbi:MAG: mannose-6-phosphate isomerase, class I [Anaerolineae bacterium]|nr:mannose-6-phosphate isomerase, class I [Anaerolineae bacterium]